MVWSIVEIAVWVIVGLALLIGAGYVAGRWFFVERVPDEVHNARTADGWRIAVVRYRCNAPAGQTNAGGDPVLLIHGVAANRLNMDLSDQRSLARFLADAGHDTWCVELRGRGLSTKPRLFTRYRWDWCFDEYVEQDLPVAIDAVLRATRAEKVHLVGFSVGGAVVYAFLGDPRLAEKVRTACAIGAPATYGFQRKYLYSWPLRNLRWLRHRLVMRLFAPLAVRPKLLMNPDNIDRSTVRRMMVNVACNFARNEALQYGDWIENDTFRSIDHRRDYRKSMEKITTPLLFIAGNKDRIAPPPSVKDAHDAVASTDKKLVIVSRGHGFKANYGHFDLVLGKQSADEVFPLVRQWLVAHGPLLQDAPADAMVPAKTEGPAAAEETEDEDEEALRN
jgi:pimeloyl-ACP methyl ester carboxylesterase